MPTITLSTLQTYVWDRVEGNSTLYTTTEVTNALNEFVRVTNAFTGMNQTTVNLPGGTVANQILYAVPVGILYPLEVAINGSFLWRFSIELLARSYRNWATDVTAKLGPIQRWASVGISSFILHPLDSVGGRTLSVTGVVEPTPLVNPTDVIQLEDAYVTAAVEYAAHRVRLKEGGKPFADASVSLQSFYRLLKERNILQVKKMPRYFVQTGPPQPA